MIELYLVMVTLTGIHLARLNRPKQAAHWLALAGLSALWPVLVAWVIYGMIRCGWSWERGAGEEKDGR